MTSPVRDADQGMIDPLPGLTLAERRLMDELAGTNESLRQLLDRLKGLSAETERQRVTTPAVVFPDPTVPQPPFDFEPNAAAPLVIDRFGRLRISTYRAPLDNVGQLIIPAGEKVSNWISCDLSGINSMNGCGIYDARGRLTTEVVTLECSPKRSQPSPAYPSDDAWTLQANIFGATLGRFDVITGGVVYQRWVRAVSSAPVSTDLTFTLVGTW